jgi:uncharacterized protein (DUF58 family)
VIVRPTRTLLGTLVAAVLLNLLSRVTGDGWLALASGAILAVGLSGLVLRPALRDLQVTMPGQPRTVAGAGTEVVFVVTNSGQRSTPPVLWTHPRVVQVQVPALAPGESYEVRLPVPALPRGSYDLGGLQLSTTAPFGVLRWTATRDGHGELIVHPNIALDRVLPAQGGVPAELRSLAVAGAGTEVLGLRPWRQGDASRAISARASARHGRPVVLERERETGPALAIIICGPGHGSAWEAAVSEVASLAVASVRAGHAPLLAVGPGKAVVPRRPDATAVLDLFARLGSTGPVDPADLAAVLRAAGRGGTVLLLGDGSDAVARRASAAGCRVVTLGRPDA